MSTPKPSDADVMRAERVMGCMSMMTRASEEARIWATEFAAVRAEAEAACVERVRVLEAALRDTHQMLVSEPDQSDHEDYGRWRDWHRECCAKMLDILEAKALAREFGVDRSSIYKALRGISWKNG